LKIDGAQEGAINLPQRGGCGPVLGEGGESTGTCRGDARRGGGGSGGGNGCRGVGSHFGGGMVEDCRWFAWRVVSLGWCVGWVVKKEMSMVLGRVDTEWV